jgi:hypothetical protein
MNAQNYFLNELALDEGRQRNSGVFQILDHSLGVFLFVDGTYHSHRVANALLVVVTVGLAAEAEAEAVKGGRLKPNPCISYRGKL